MKAATQAAPEFELPAHLRTALLFGMACISTMAAAVFLELSVMSSVCLFLVAGIFYFYYKYGFQSTRQIKTLALISSAACTVIALLGRYSKEDNLYYGIRMEDFQNSPVQQGLLTAFIAAGLLLFFYFCFQRLYECAGRFTILRTKAPPMENWAVFLCCFLIIFICWLPYFLAYFPGILSNDSVWQMDQILGIRPLSNHHPFTHTMIIKLFYSIGYAIFGTANAGIATYTLFQMTTMASSSLT